MTTSESPKFTKSFRPFKSNDDYLFAVKEDLAEWLNGIHSACLTPEGFFNTIEDGIMLCQHANKIREYLLEAKVQTNAVTYKLGAKPESWHARDNVANFIAWIRANLSIHEVLLFETDDLVLRKNVQSVLLCLLQVAREGSKYGMDVPMLVRLEKEIELTESSHSQKASLDEVDAARLKETMEMLKSLDELVQDSLRKCTCPSQFPMYQVDNGKYRIGESKTVVFVRVLRNHVMIRVGGGWDTLEHYLDKHDPCRCSGVGHRRSKAPSPLLLGQTNGSPSTKEKAGSGPTKENSTSATTTKEKVTSAPKENGSALTKEKNGSPLTKEKTGSASTKERTSLASTKGKTGSASSKGKTGLAASAKGKTGLAASAKGKTGSPLAKDKTGSGSRNQSVEGRLSPRISTISAKTGRSISLSRKEPRVTCAGPKPKGQGHTSRIDSSTTGGRKLSKFSVNQKSPSRQLQRLVLTTERRVSTQTPKKSNIERKRWLK